METFEGTKTGYVKAVGDEGILTIAFAREGDTQPDKDGDFFDVGSLRVMKGTQVPLAQFGHSGELPVGVGTLGRASNDATWTGQVNMKHPMGPATFEYAKAMGADAEASFRFRSAKHSSNRRTGGKNFHDAEVFEVSLVMVGAGNHTAVTDAKAETGSGDGVGNEGIQGLESQALAILWEV